MINDNQQIELLRRAVQAETSVFERGVQYALAFVITDQATYNQAFDDIRLCRERVALLKAQADVITKPLQSVIDYVTETLQPKLRAAQMIEQELKRKAIAWKADADVRAQRAQIEAQRLLTASTTAFAAPIEAQRAAISAIEQARPPKVDGVHYRKYYHYEIIDESKLEPVFFKRVIDKSACQAFANENQGDPLKSRPGLRLFTSESPVIR